MELAAFLGFVHPDYMHEQLTARQYDDWIKYSRSVGSLSIARNDILFAQLAVLWAKDSKITDFMPHYDIRNIYTDEELKEMELERWQEYRMKLKIQKALAEKKAAKPK